MTLAIKGADGMKLPASCVTAYPKPTLFRVVAVPCINTESSKKALGTTASTTQRLHESPAQTWTGVVSLPWARSRERCASWFELDAADRRRRRGDLLLHRSHSGADCIYAIASRSKSRWGNEVSRAHAARARHHRCADPFHSSHERVVLAAASRESRRSKYVSGLRSMPPVRGHDFRQRRAACRCRTAC